MTWLEELFITLAVNITRAVVKNPQHAAAVRAQMLGVADDIYTAYGITPPQHD